MIEELGYSEENKKIYCTSCIIFQRTGKCEFLNYLESKITADLNNEYFQEILIDDCGF
jgi:late competence protein required for DNA uptake (superfamily II DNA/RNA helicase)